MENDTRISKVEQRVSQLETDVQVIRASYAPQDLVGDLRGYMTLRFSEMDSRLAQMDAELVGVHSEIGSLHARLDKLEDKVDKLQADIGDLKGLFFKALMLNNLAVFGILIAVLRFFP